MMSELVGAKEWWGIHDATAAGLVFIRHFVVDASDVESLRKLRAWMETNATSHWRVRFGKRRNRNRIGTYDVTLADERDITLFKLFWQQDILAETRVKWVGPLKKWEYGNFPAE